MTTLPVLFVGSSSEGLSVAQTVQQALNRNANVVVWTDNVFQPGVGFLDALHKAASNCDFAIFVFTPDDKLDSRGTLTRSPRDNVVFELGLFMGTIGRDRTFVLKQDGVDIKVLSDLSGVSYPTYTYTSGDNLQALISTACQPIRDVMRKKGFLERRARSRVAYSFRPMSTDVIDRVADGAITVSDQRFQYAAELKRHIINGDMLPTKYLYYTDLGASLWLEICKKQAYRFYRNSIDLLNSEIKLLIDKASEAVGGNEFDFVSLGCGDGHKDSIILREMTRRIADTDKRISYFPMDINESMLVEGIRTALAGVDRRLLGVKGLLGDLTRLRDFESVYEMRPMRNFFSVLGNTLGNNDEAHIMGALDAALLPGDVVLVEVSVGSHEDEKALPFHHHELNMQHDFSPLTSLGIPFDPKIMKYEHVKGMSVVPDTETVLAVCEGFSTLHGFPVLPKRIKLSAVHHYKLNPLVLELEHRLHVRGLYAREKNGVALILLQRAENA